MRIRSLLLLGALVGLLAAASPAQAITGGTPDGTQHPYVALAHNGEFVCSAVAISPTLLLTAAHCFDFPVDTVAVTFSPSVFSPGTTFALGTWYADPMFCLACAPGLVGFDTHDIAVIELFAPMALPRYATLPSAGLVDRLPNKAQVTLVGYGVSGFVTGGGRPQPIFTGERLTAPSTLIPSNHSIADEFIKISANQSKGKGGVCDGDSGSPVLLGDTVLALNSFVTNGRCSGVTYAYRVDTPAALGFVADFK
jgi:hypothetical protein